MISAVSLDDMVRRQLHKHTVDLLIADINYKLHMATMLCSLPIVIVTCDHESKDTSKLKALGATGVLSKPLDVRQLRQTVRACIGLSVRPAQR